MKLKKIEKITSEQKQTNIQIIGEHIKKYRFLMIAALAIICLIEITFIIFWNYDENNYGDLIDNTYLFSQIGLLAVSLLVIVALVVDKFKHFSNKGLAIILHAYSFLIVAWGTVNAILDLSIGLTPYIFFLVCTAMSSLLVIEPIFFGVICLSSTIVIVIFNINKHFEHFHDAFAVENIINFIVFIALFLLISYRHFSVTVREHKALKKVEHMTYNDELTGLMNERSYLNAIDDINKQISSGNVTPFAVVLMDVNNLKVTNDTYGHRYGCHLIVRTGHTLPEVFKTSKLFHIGGDEFLAILTGEDYENFEEVIKKFDETFKYSHIEHEGKDLIFSVARGFAKYQEGNQYKDVLQKADAMMYLNKAEIKSTYNMKGR